MRRNFFLLTCRLSKPRLPHRLSIVRIHSSYRWTNTFCNAHIQERGGGALLIALALRLNLNVKAGTPSRSTGTGKVVPVPPAHWQAAAPGPPAVPLPVPVHASAGPCWQGQFAREPECTTGHAGTTVQ